MTRKTLGKTHTASLFSAFLFVLSPLGAQQPDPFGADQPPTTRPAGPHPVEPAPPSPTFDIDFEEATAAEACEFIQQKLSELDEETPFNIVVSKEAENIILPSMRLRQITFEQFARFINSIGGGVQHLIPANDPFAEGGGDSRPPHRGDRFGISDNDGIWYFWAEKAPTSKAASGASGEIMTKTFFVGEDSESTLSLIETSLEASKAVSTRPQPTLKFHEASKSLIVVGHVQDIKLIDDIIAVLKQQQESKFMAERRTAADRHQLEKEKWMQSIEIQMRLAEARKTVSDDHPMILELEKQLKALAEEDSHH